MSKYVGLNRGKVHDERISSEYYCGGCGWPVTDHDSYCPECGGAFQESFATERWGGTRWHEMFSTPERAARTLTYNAPSTCDECVLIDMCDIGMPATCMVRDRDALLEWMKGGA